MAEIRGTDQYFKYNFGLSDTFSFQTTSSTCERFGRPFLDSSLTRNGQSHTSASGTTDSGASPQHSKFCIKNVFSPQKRRVFPPCIQPKAVKSFLKNNKISFNFCKPYTRLHSTQGLDDKNRSDTSLLSCAYSKVSSLFSPLNISGQAFTNDLFTFRASHCSQGICFPFQLDGRKFQGTGYTNSGFSGRLPYSIPKSNSAARSNTVGNTNDAAVGLANQLEEVYSSSSKTNRILRLNVGPVAKSQISTRFENKQDTINIVRVSQAKIGQSTRSPELGGSTEFRSISSSFGQIKFPAPFTSLHPVASLTNKVPSAVADRDSNRVEVVGTSLPNNFGYTSPQKGKFSHNGRCGLGVGCGTKRSFYQRLLVRRGRTVSLELQRNDNRSKMSPRVRSHSESFVSSFAIGQQVSRSLSEKRRREQIQEADGLDVRDISNTSEVSYSYCSLPYPGQIQHDCGRFVSSSVQTSGVAPSPRDNTSYFWKVGHSGNRSLCLQRCSRSGEVRIYGPERSTSVGSQRLCNRVVFQKSMDFPTPEFNASGSNALESSPRCLLDSSPPVAECFLEGRSQDSGNCATIHDSQPKESADRHIDGPASPTCTGSVSRSLEMWGWADSISSWSEEQKVLLSKGWRPSTISTYKPAWRRWLKWCLGSNVKYNDPTGSDLARFLADLHLKEKLSYKTILLHKSVVSQLCNVGTESRLSSNLLVKQMLKSISTQSPKSRSNFIWDTRVLEDWLSNSSPSENSLFEISCRCAVLLLLCSGRRVHDLSLLSIGATHCLQSNDSIVLWPKFGSKTDSDSYIQSGWKLLKNVDNQNLDPVFWLQKLISLGQDRRSSGSTDSLFVSIRGKAGPASKTVIAGWVKSVLRNAGIEASAGSFRSAVASRSWLDSESLDVIMSRANWRSSNTFKNFYRREVVSASNSSISRLFEAV